MNGFRNIIVGTCLAFFPTTAAQAVDEIFIAPDGCQTFLSLQSNGCQTYVFWRCAAAPAGEFWEATFAADGLASVVHYDREYQWLDAEYFWDQSREVLDNPGNDPISLRDLLDNGRDTFAFSLIRHEPDQSYVQYVAGHDELTGNEVTIDGVKLLESSAHVTITNEAGETEYESQNLQLLSREMGLLFFAKDSVTFEDGTTEEFDNTPVDFLYPGEPGFAEMTPLYQCELPPDGDSKEGDTKKG